MRTEIQSPAPQTWLSFPEPLQSHFCYWAVRELGMTATSLAKALGLTQPAVSISVKRGWKIADENGFQLLDE